MKFGFYVSGKATRLIETINYLIKTFKRYPNDYISFIISDQLNDDLIALANTYNIELFSFDYKSIDLNGVKKSVYVSNLLLEKALQNNVKYLFVFGNKILSGELLKIFKNKIINFHPSVLPAFKGLRAIDQALSSNAFLFGNTAHFIDEGVDTGPIIMQQLMHRTEYQDYDTILNKQVYMLIQIMDWLQQERIVLEDCIVKVRNANYSVNEFIPNLEL